MQIRIPAAELFAAVKTAKKLAGKFSGDAAWKFTDGTLTMDWAGACSTIAGSGDGQGTVRLRDAQMRELSRVQPHQGEVTVRFFDGRLYVERFSMEAEAVEGDSTSGDVVPQLLGINPPLREIIALPYRHDPATIQAAGLGLVLASAEIERMRATAKVASILEPFGISADAVLAFVESELARVAKESGGGGVSAIGRFRNP